WCISRQLWWGHRIPAWHCGDCKGMTVAREAPSECSKCGSMRIEQDADVLDTWFSSGLWPFSTLGWPDDTQDLPTFYPTTLLVSGAPGNDIALSEDRIAATRAFANKIWNASRLLFNKSGGDAVKASLADRWIASRLNACAEVTNRAFEQHRYHESADALWHFFWDEFCDWYLELKKLDADWGY